MNSDVIGVISQFIINKKDILNLMLVSKEVYQKVNNNVNWYYRSFLFLRYYVLQDKIKNLYPCLDRASNTIEFEIIDLLEIEDNIKYDYTYNYKEYFRSMYKKFFHLTFRIFVPIISSHEEMLFDLNRLECNYFFLLNNDSSPRSLIGDRYLCLIRLDRCQIIKIREKEILDNDPLLIVDILWLTSFLLPKPPNKNDFKMSKRELIKDILYTAYYNEDEEKIINRGIFDIYLLGSFSIKKLQYFYDAILYIRTSSKGIYNYISQNIKIIDTVNNNIEREIRINLMLLLTVSKK